MWLLFGAASLLLLIACTNIATLLLTRGAERRRDVSIRLSLGARPSRIARQWLTETALLAGVGAAAGLLLASAGTPLAGPVDIRNQLAASDIPRPTVKLSDGREIRLDDQGYTIARSAQNRADRKLVFDKFWASYKAFESSLGASLAAQVKGDLFRAKARHYDSALQASLDGANLQQVRAARPTFDYDVRYGATGVAWTTDNFVEAVYTSLKNPPRTGSVR